MRDMTVDVDRDPKNPGQGREPRRPFGDIRLPCCKPCNDELNRRFENPGLTPARALLVDGVQNLKPKQVDRVRWWVLKTWVLLTHPLADLSPVNFVGAAWLDADASFFEWLVNKGEPQKG